MTNTLAETSPSTRGRIIAVLYLIVIAGGLTAQAGIADTLVVRDDATRTAANILANETLYRLGYTIFLVEMVAQVAMSVLFYDLLKPVDRGAARVATVIGVTGAGIKTFARTFYYAPLILLGGAPSFGALTPAQLETLSLALYRVGGQGAAIALVFFGFETVLRGWLVLKSGFLPRFLGVLSMVSGLGWLTFLWPPFGNRVFIVVALFAIAGVLATVGWLLIKGVDDAKWRARAALASSSIWR